MMRLANLIIDSLSITTGDVDFLELLSSLATVELFVVAFLALGCEPAALLVALRFAMVLMLCVVCG